MPVSAALRPKYYHKKHRGIYEKKLTNKARHLAVSYTHLGAFKVDRSGGVSAVLDRIRSTLVELFPHDHPPNQSHTVEHVW